MAWRTIADSEVDPESPVTTSLAIAWRDNPIAIAQGLSGAERVVYGALNLSNDLTQGDIANSAIGQGELKTTTGTITEGPSSDNVLEFERDLPGGQYGFAEQFDFDSNFGSSNTLSGMLLTGLFGGYTWTKTADVIDDGSIVLEPFKSTGTGDRGPGLDRYAYMLVGSQGSSGADGVIQQRYIQASPPYSVDGEEIPLFVFLRLNNGGEIEGTYVAYDPPWAYNGPTNIAPDWVGRDGRKFKRVAHQAVTTKDVVEGRASVDELIAAVAVREHEYVEISEAVKNADMGLHPHSWRPGTENVIMLDPHSTEMQQLYDLHAAGEPVWKLMKYYMKPSVEKEGMPRPPETRGFQLKWRQKSKR